MLTSGEMSIIGNIFNTTWGRFSTDKGDFPRGSAPPGSLTGKLVPIVGPPLQLPLDTIKKERVPGASGDGSEHYLVVTYTDLVTFRSDLEMQVAIKAFRQQAERVCKVRVEALRKEFRGAAGRSLKVKFKEGHDSVEAHYTPTPQLSLIAAPALRPTLFRGYYRYVGVYIVS